LKVKNSLSLESPSRKLVSSTENILVHAENSFDFTAKNSIKNAMSVLVYGAVSNVPKTLRPADGNVA
jgi:hypothetical protein